MAELRKKDARREEPVETVEVPREAVDVPVEPRVTAVLIGHNEAAALRRAIQALEKSDNRDRLEIIVIDNGSSDDSGSLDLEFEGISLLRMPHDLGLTKTLNMGTRTSRAELVLFLSPNVEVAPDTITKLADRLEGEIELSAVAPLLVDESGRVFSKSRPLVTREILKAACAGEPIPTTEIDASQESVDVLYPQIEALLVRKHFIKGMNYFDERFGQHWADADLAAQIRRALRKARVYPAIRATFRAAPDPRAKDPLLAPDCILGAAGYLSKYEGFMSGFTFRLGAIFGALVRFQFGKLGALLSGQKLDGTQAM